MTIVIVPFFWLVFPVSPTEAWFLTADEKTMMQARYDADPTWGYNEEFSWGECLKAFTDPKWYAFFAYQFSVNISLYGLTTFMPAIVRGLGYTSVTANLMTVPIYICALVFFLVIAYFSDRTGVRGPYMAGCLLCLIVGYALLISVDNLKVRFFACFGKLLPLRIFEDRVNRPQLLLSEFTQQRACHLCGCKTTYRCITSERLWLGLLSVLETLRVSLLDRSSPRRALHDT